MAATTKPIAQTLGPGSLKFGDTGEAREFAASTSKTTFKPEMADEDAVGLLSGDDYQPEGEWSGSLEGTFFQEYSKDSLIAWCFEHAGELIAFEFKPRADAALTWKGKCVIAPVEVGGDAKKTNTTDFTFKLVGKPTLDKAGA